MKGINGHTQNLFDIFADFNRAAAQIHKSDSIRQLEQENKKLKNECGSCKHWMTQNCPLEAKGEMINMKHRICVDFVLDNGTASTISANENKIAELQKVNP